MSRKESDPQRGQSERDRQARGQPRVANRRSVTTPQKWQGKALRGFPFLFICGTMGKKGKGGVPMSVVTRQFQMVYLLLEKGRMTAGELARRLEVSQRTVLRDVDAQIGRAHV